MSKPNLPNEYSTPEFVNSPQSPATGLRYGEMVSHVFENPDWFTNVLLGGVCFLIPIVGPIVLLGYRYEVIDHWNRYSQATYPNFDFNKFGEYLSRGIWPFLVLLVGSLLVIPLMIVCYFASGMVFLFAGALGPEFAIVGILLAFLVLFGGIILCAAVSGLVLVPLELKAGMQRDFAAGFDIKFISNFIGLTWKEILIGFLFLYVVNLALSLVGMLILCVGVYFTMAVAIMAQTHFEHQLYLLYLQRGGTPIPTPTQTTSQAPQRPSSGW